VTNPEKARLRTLRAWAQSLGLNVEQCSSFKLYDRKTGQATKEVYSLDALEEALTFLNESKGGGQ